MLFRSSSRVLKDEHGQTNIEYALIIAGIGILLMAGVFLLGGRIGDRAATSSAPISVLKPPTTQCDQHYAGACVPPAPPDLDCSHLRALGVALPVRVVGGDPHNLDPDGDGLGC